MADAALTAEVIKLGEKIDALGQQMVAIGQHVGTLADNVRALNAPPSPAERLRRLFSEWGPVVAIIVTVMFASLSFSDRLKSAEQTDLKLTERVGELAGAVSALKDAVSDLRKP